MVSRKILIEVGHPAHVHQFKNLYWELEKSGWQGLFVAKKKECVIDLLEYHNLPYVLFGINRPNVLIKIVTLPYYILKMIRISSNYKPDVFISRVSPLSGFASLFLRKFHITFTDTESSRLLDVISEPFADAILTSDSYRRKHGKRQARYLGYHELAYLHPKRFVLNPTILNDLSLVEKERYAIVRFVSWTAHHDIGQKGLTNNNKIRLVNELAKYLKVFISSEGELPLEFQDYRIKIKPEQMHDALNYAHLYVGESSTMASECAMLGTPAIFINNNKFGCTEDQKKYGLLFQYSESEEDQEKLIEKGIELAKEDYKEEFIEKRDLMLKDKIDVTAFMVWFVENYPESFRIMKEDPGYQERFR